MLFAGIQVPLQFTSPHDISPHHWHHTSVITDIHHQHFTSHMIHDISPNHSQDTSHITQMTHKSDLTTNARELPQKMNIEEVEEAEITRITCSHPESTESTRITTKNKHRKNWTPRKYENYHEKWTSKKLKNRKGEKVRVLLWNRVKKHPTPTKSVRITTKSEHGKRSRAEKVWDLPRETRFRPFEEHRRTPRSTKITTLKSRPTTWATRNIRELPRKTNIENIIFTTKSVRHL